MQCKQCEAWFHADCIYMISAGGGGGASAVRVRLLSGFSHLAFAFRRTGDAGAAARQQLPWPQCWAASAEAEAAPQPPLQPPLHRSLHAAGAPTTGPTNVYHLNRMVWAAPGSEEEELR